MERVADGVWLLRGDARKAMNVYFLEDEGGAVQFDAGTKAMTKKVRTAAERLGGVKRIVLGHGHADHRGTAPVLGVPVLCHPDEVSDAESSASIAPYMDISQLPWAPARWVYPLLMRRWDGGAVKIDGTVSEGDEVAGFRVVHFPGQRPPPRLGLGPRQGKGVGAQAGGAGTGDGLRRARGAPAGGEPARDAGASRGEALSRGGGRWPRCHSFRP